MDVNNKAADPASADPASPSAQPTATTEGGAVDSAKDTQGADAKQGDEWGDFDADRAKRTITNQRNAEAELKKQLAEAKAKVEEFERSQLSDAEKVTADLEKAQADLVAARAETDKLKASQAFDAAAIAAGVNPRAIDAARAIAPQVATADETGTLTYDTAAFDRLKAEHAYLFTAPQTASQPVTFGAASSQGLGGNPTTLTAEQVAFAQKAGIKSEDFQKYSGSVVK